MSLSAREFSTLALLAQKEKSQEVDLDTLGLAGEARSLAERLLADEEPDDPTVVRQLRGWAREAGRFRR